jgi:hypothetical protein
MKKQLIPFLMLTYVFSLCLLSVLAFIGTKAAYDPQSTAKWLIAIIVFNIISYVYTMIWSIDIAEEDKS